MGDLFKTGTIKVDVAVTDEAIVKLCLGLVITGALIITIWAVARKL